VRRCQWLTTMVLLVAVMSLAACTRETVNGTDEPPASFGKVQGNVMGCADIAGLYAWPPAQGDTRAHSLTNEKFRSGQSLEPIKVSLPDEGQIWLSGVTQGRALVVRTRMANAGMIARGELSNNWSYADASRAALFCRGSFVSMNGETIVQERSDRSGRRESSSEGLKMARLRDGSLAFGQWVRYSGRRNSIDIFGAELANFPAGDVVNWNWARLARIGESGKPAAAAPSTAPSTAPAK
jgi:hypothetical protein